MTVEAWGLIHRLRYAVFLGILRVACYAVRELMSFAFPRAASGTDATSDVITIRSDTFLIYRRGCEHCHPRIKCFICPPLTIRTEVDAPGVW